MHNQQNVTFLAHMKLKIELCVWANYREAAANLAKAIITAATELFLLPQSFRLPFFLPRVTTYEHVLQSGHRERERDWLP
jgi:hypothetical protein